jgi:hypothetical protein
MAPGAGEDRWRPVRWTRAPPTTRQEEDRPATRPPHRTLFLAESAHSRPRCGISRETDRQQSHGSAYEQGARFAVYRHYPQRWERRRCMTAASAECVAITPFPAPHPCAGSRTGSARQTAHRAGVASAGSMRCEQLVSTGYSAFVLWSIGLLSRGVSVGPGRLQGRYKSAFSCNIRATDFARRIVSTQGSGGDAASGARQEALGLWITVGPPPAGPRRTGHARSDPHRLERGRLRLVHRLADEVRRWTAASNSMILDATNN